MIAPNLSRKLIKAVPCKIHNIFKRVCSENKIEHRKNIKLMPFTNDEVERMNRILKEAMVNNFHYASLRWSEYLYSYLMAYNLAKHLNAIKGKTPWQFILNQWATNSEYFTTNSNRFLVGLNI